MVADLRLYTATNGLPPPEIARTVAASIARQLGLDHDDLLSVAEVWSELLREILTNPYVSADEKSRYADAFAVYQRNEARVIKRRKKHDKGASSVRLVWSSSQVPDSQKKNPNMSLAMSAALFSLLGTIIAALAALGVAPPLSLDINPWWMITVVSILAITITVFAGWLTNFAKHRIIPTASRTSSNFIVSSNTSTSFDSQNQASAPGSSQSSFKNADGSKVIDQGDSAPDHSQEQPQDATVTTPPYES